jgi:hypothetical protein
MNEAHPQSSGEEVSASKVSPTKTRNNSREDEANKQHQLEVPPMLPSHDRVPGKIADVRNTRLSSRFDDHPTDMRPEDLILCGVWVKFGVGIAVVCAMSPRPPFDRTFSSTRTHKRKHVLHWNRRVVRSMGPETVITCSDAKTTSRSWLPGFSMEEPKTSHPVT